VIGGMAAASGMGIFFVPAIYYMIEKISSASRSTGSEQPILPSPQQGD